jgi:hypothetical protein
MEPIPARNMAKTAMPVIASGFSLMKLLARRFAATDARKAPLTRRIRCRHVASGSMSRL